MVAHAKGLAVCLGFLVCVSLWWGVRFGQREGCSLAQPPMNCPAVPDLLTKETSPLPSPLRQKQRVAMLLPIYGGRLVDILPYFIQTCGGRPASDEDLDKVAIEWFIFHESMPLFHKWVKDPPFPIPANLHFVDLKHDGFATLFGQKRAEALHLDVKQQVSLLKRSFAKSGGYLLTELKPMFGHVFEDYLLAKDGSRRFTHWAWVDWDIIWGDIYRWIEPQELADFDVISYAYDEPHGDPVLRGQLTLFKNVDSIKHYWMSCHLLSSPDTLLRPRGSDERCFSFMLINYSTLRVKITMKQTIVRARNDTAIYWIDGRLFKYQSTDANRLHELKNLIRDYYTTLFHSSSPARDVVPELDGFDLDLRPTDGSPIVEVSSELRQVFLRPNLTTCTVWMEQPEWRICLDVNEKQHHLFRQDGRFFVQSVKFKNDNERAFLHMQGWKSGWDLTKITKPPERTRLLVLEVTQQGFDPLVTIPM